LEVQIKTMELNEKLKARRIELGLSLEQVGDYVGVGKSTVRKWETGDIKNMGRTAIKKYAEILRISPLVILGYEDEQIPIHLPRPEAVRTIPVYGDISCGNGLFIEDNIIDTVSVPVSMLPNKSAEYFAQYASGNSMSGVGINDGDLIVFRKTSQIENGQIGCFCIDDNVATCKKFSRIGGSIYLMPANDEYQPIPIEPENTCFRVVGLYVLQIKSVK